jgi:hypothetical protein
MRAFKRHPFCALLGLAMDALLDDFSLSCSEDDSGCDLPFSAFAFGSCDVAALDDGLAAPAPRARRRRGAAEPDKARGSYNCSKCGQPKRGHGAFAATRSSALKGRCVRRSRLGRRRDRAALRDELLPAARRARGLRGSVRRRAGLTCPSGGRGSVRFQGGGGRCAARRAREGAGAARRAARACEFVGANARRAGRRARPSCPPSARRPRRKVRCRRARARRAHAACLRRVAAARALRGNRLRGRRLHPGRC